MSVPDAHQRAAAERWFLSHGLPAVLRPGALVRRVVSRSAPALAAFAVMMVVLGDRRRADGQTHHRYQRHPDPHGVVRAGHLRVCVAGRRPGGLGGVPHRGSTVRGRRRGDRDTGHGRGRILRRTQSPAVREHAPRGRRRNAHLAQHRNGSRFHPGLGAEDDICASRLARGAAGAGVAGDAVDGAGVLQRHVWTMAHDGEPHPAVDGAAVPVRHRRGISGVQHVESGPT